MTSADVVIIGCGGIGASAAFHLARRRAGRVVVLERDRPGTGSTGWSAGGIRQQFSTRVNVQMSVESVRFFERFAEVVGSDAGFQQVGYLFAASHPDDLAVFEHNVEMQRSVGVDVELLHGADAGRRWPYLNTDDVTAATYCATDGYASPHDVVNGFIGAAQQGGVTLLNDTLVESILTRAGRVAGVRTSAGDIDAPAVVLATGVHSPRLAQTVGLDVPVLPYRRQLFVTEPFDGLPHDAPMTIDYATGWYFRPEGDRFLIAGPKNRDSNFHTGFEWSALEQVAPVAVHRVPALARASFATGWGGLLDVTPDSHAIIDAVPEIPGLVIATGFSGHGFMHSPSAGRIVAELVMDGYTTGIDVSSLDLARFGRGELLLEAMTLHKELASAE